MHFLHLNNTVRTEQKCKSTKNCQVLKNGWKYRKILKLSALGVFRSFSKSKDYWF